MSLLTNEDLKKLPALYSTDGQGYDAIVQIKLFFPLNAMTWFLTEYDPIEKIAFGFAYLGDWQCAELGYIILNELESLDYHGVKVEKDISFEPKKLSEAIAELKLYFGIED